jgi:hypothetical protein
LRCGKEESFDIVSDPNAESTSTSLVSRSVATEHAVSANRLVTQIIALEGFEKSVSIECPDELAVRTGGKLEIEQEAITIVLRATDSRATDSEPHDCLERMKQKRSRLVGGARKGGRGEAQGTESFFEGELRVASCELRVASCELRVAELVCKRR